VARSTKVACALVLAALASPIVTGDARAQPQPRGAPMLTEADRVFELGRQAATSGQFAEACRYFRQSLKLDPAAVGTLINLGDCEENQGHPAVALAFYEQAFSRLSVTDDRLPLVHERVASLEKRSARLEIRLGDGAPQGTKVTLDGEVLESKALGTSLLVTAGNHLVVVTAVGYRGSRQGVGLGPAEARTLRVWPGPPLEEAIPTFVEQTDGVTDGRETRARWLRIGGLTAVGLGVASLWVGSVAGLFAIDRESTRNDNCNANNVCNQTGMDAARSGDTFATVSTATLIGGGIAVVGGLYLFLSNRTPAPAAAPQTAVVPSAGLHGGGVTFSHSF